MPRNTSSDGFREFMTKEPDYHPRGPDHFRFPRNLASTAAAPVIIRITLPGSGTVDGGGSEGGCGGGGGLQLVPV